MNFLNRLFAAKDETPNIETLITDLKDDDRVVRLKAAQALQKVEDPCVVEPLIAALKDSDYDVRSSAAQALGSNHDVRAVEVLIESLSDDESGLRFSAAKALGDIGDERAVQALINTLRDDDRLVGYAAAKALVEIGDLRAVEPLIVLLMDATAETRADIAMVLESLGWTPTNDGAGAAFWAAKWEWNRCLKIGAPAVEPLIVVLKDGDEEARYNAAELLGKIGDVRAVEALGAALTDPDSGVRHSAAVALKLIGHADAVESLCIALKDSDSSIRIIAVESLNTIGDLRAVEPLAGALQDSEWLVRSLAAQALGQLGDPRAVEALGTALRDSDSLACGRVAEALGKIGDARAVEILTEAANGPDPLVRAYAKKEINGLGEPVSQGGAAISCIGMRFDIGKVDGSERGYGEACWRIFWRAVDIGLVAGAQLLEGDTAASPEQENVYCLAARWWTGSGKTEDIRDALSRSEEFKSAAAEPFFIDLEQVSREPLVEAGQVDLSGHFVGTSHRARPAYLAVCKERGIADEPGNSRS